MTLEEILVDQFGYEEPITTNDLKTVLENKTENTLRRQLNRLAEMGKVKKYSYREGIFYVENPDALFKKKTLSTDKVIEKLYLFDNGRRIGYFSGFSVANLLSLTTQNPFVLEIVTNNTKSKKRNLTLNTREFILRKPKVEINNRNYKLLQVLDLMNDFERYSDTPIEKSRNRIIEYLVDVDITCSDLKYYLRKYPAKTSKGLIESGLYDEITQKQRTF